jgi:hypothetical protein
MCQRFIEVPSNRDLVNLVILGGGTLVMDIITRKATCNRFLIEPLPYVEDARRWLFSRMVEHKISNEQLAGASLTVEYAVELSRKSDIPIFPVAKFDFACSASITSPDRLYTSTLAAEKTIGLYTI